jgi:hypothetical protein
MARRWIRGVLVVAGAVVAGLAGIPALIEWQGTRMLRQAGLPSATVDVMHLGLAGGTVEVRERTPDGRKLGTLDLRYTLAEGISGHIDLDLPVDGLMPPGVTTMGAVLHTTGTVAPLDGWHWRFEPDGCVTVTAKRLVMVQATITRPESLCLKPVPDRDFLVFDPAEGWRVAFKVSNAPLAVQTPDVKVFGNLPDTTVEAFLSPHGDLNGLDVDWRQGVLRLPDQGLVSEGFSGTLSVDGSAGHGLKVDYAIATIRQDREHPVVAPLRLSGRAVGSLDGSIDFNATVADHSSLASMALKGRHDMPIGVGQANVRMKPTLFGTDAAQFTTLFPIAPDWIDQLTGTVGFEGRIGWGDGADRGRAEILLKDVAIDTGAATASGINAVVTADRLSPLHLPAGQTVSVTLMDVGLPLTDGEIRFGVEGNRLSITKAEWNWAGGWLKATPFETGMKDPDLNVALEADGVDLQQLLALAAIDGLSASGTLHGSLPLHVSTGTVAIETGRLETTGPGTLRYDPTNPPAFLSGDPGSGTDMLLQALTDFRYDSLALSIDGTAGGEMTLSFAIRGSNKDFYDGYPVALNLKVGGALDTILRRGLATYRIPSTVRDRMIEFQDRSK